MSPPPALRNRADACSAAISASAPRWARETGVGDSAGSASVWCFANRVTPWWGGMWADRILHSAMAEQALDCGLSDPLELADLPEGWWESRQDDGWFAILHGGTLGPGD